YFQIVRRTEGNELTRHRDFEDMVYSGIVYLNDRYEGGRTYLEIGSEQTVIVPEIGKAIGFDGARIPHGIFPVTKGIRFAVSCWWKTMDWVPADVAAALTRTPMRLQDPMFLSEKQNPDFPYAD
ncbi:MAG: 2OG-Fe(II) oxygenase, partial [bacterium]